MFKCRDICHSVGQRVSRVLMGRLEDQVGPNLFNTSTILFPLINYHIIEAKNAERFNGGSCTEIICPGPGAKSLGTADVCTSVVNVTSLLRPLNRYILLYEPHHRLLVE
ncbi:uncharacterized protein LOC116414233 [Apis florea]|uniref:uncharacterized protein LOC116414233 n=1 Tax=Apis florea TaxID=7463 RepID=UPI0012FF4AD4|nr:uncharacterized protein LOC116414233 [Apis florea]